MKKLSLMLMLCALSVVAKSPNVLLVHLDDEKFAGQDFSEQIPTIKALQSKALTLDNFYSVTINENVVELLSGKYPANVKNVAILGDMQADEACVAKDLKTLGYSTAYIGKWRNSKEVFPNHLGFDSFFGILDNDSAWPYLWQLKAAQAGKLQESGVREANLSLMLGANIIDMPYSSKKIIPDFTKEAMGFIIDSKEKSKPFFLYLNYASSYARQLGLKTFFPDVDKGRIAQHYVDIDASIARILKILERYEILDDTLIIFIARSAFNPEPMPAVTPQNLYLDCFYKKSAFVYMPRIFKEPKTLDGVVATLDMPAFIVDFAKLASGEKSMLGYFLGKHSCDESPLLFYGQSKYLWAMRDKHYKLVVEKPQQKVPLQLYNLEKDPKEENNLAKNKAEKASQLLRDARTLDSQQPKIHTKEELNKIALANKQKEAEREKLAKKKEKEAKEKADKLKREAKQKEEKLKKEAKQKAEAMAKADKLKREAKEKEERLKAEAKQKAEAMAKADKLKKEAKLKEEARQKAEAMETAEKLKK